MTLNLINKRYHWVLKLNNLNSTRYILTLVLAMLLSGVKAQVVTTPLQYNPVLKHYRATHPGYEWNSAMKFKWGKKDTLNLPFFDDFSTSVRYPDSSKWLNNQVYVNNHFPELPPTLNVATFDVLDEFGIPYNYTINKNYKSAGDSLISQPINLKDSSGVPYVLSDSIIFSFFYQANGFGYHLNAEDSLRLFFKADNNSWIKVWTVAGQSATTPFEHVAIAIDNENFLHDDFQFMFTTYTRQVGNANHWHIDYVMLDAGRSVLEDTYNDYAIQSTPTSLLKEFNTMPYSHFMVNPNALVADSVYVRASNLDGNDKNIEIRHEAYYGVTELTNTAFSANANNILSQSSSERRLPRYTITGLSGPDPIVIDRMIEIRERGILNDFKDNDRIEVTQEFYDYYAYDDGTAERGFGFDHNSNPSNFPGEIAYEFNITKRDTLYAISTYFNEAVYDVSDRRFNYRIWKSLEGVNGDNVDSVIYESIELNPDYNTVNDQRAFSAHYIDTLLVLDPGRYYIGWYQRTIFNLDIGWDMNCGNSRYPYSPSAHLYYRVLEGWTNADLPNGTLMMRPHFGSSRPLHVGVKEVEQVPVPLLYPNPASDVVHFDQRMEEVTLLNASGQILRSLESVSSIDISDHDPGVYFVRLVTESGSVFTLKLLIFAN